MQNFTLDDDVIYRQEEKEKTLRLDRDYQRRDALLEQIRQYSQMP